MNKKFDRMLEAVADNVFSEKAQAVGIMVTFGILGVAALIGAFWNPSHVFTAAFCAILFLCGLHEYTKLEK